jgi:muconolactone delta-isomerase
MIVINLPKYPEQEYFSLIPAQRDHINKLMIDGTITDVALSEDRTKLWLNMNSDSENDVNRILAKFPMIAFMDFKIEKLMFHLSYSNSFQKLSLN